jgi:hypothetical protein
VISRQIILLGTGCVGDEGRAIPCVGHAGGEARYQVEQGHLILSGTRINQDSTYLEGVRRLLRRGPSGVTARDFKQRDLACATFLLVGRYQSPVLGVHRAVTLR